MRQRTYYASKVLQEGRTVLVTLGQHSLMHQTKIKYALAKMPLCEFHLSRFEATVPRPEWISELGINVRRFARGEADYDETAVIDRMAPQHKNKRLEELLHWWVSAVVAAAKQHGSTSPARG